MASSETLDCL